MPTVTSVACDHPDVAPLVSALLAELTGMYEDDDHDAGAPIAATSGSASWVLLRDDDGTPLGCGAVQRLSNSLPGAPATHGEIKRVYVVPEARGRGFSRRIMTGLTGVAAGLGYTWLQLETGTEQPGALGLYESSGWQRVPDYGQYAEDPRSICLGKVVPPTPDPT